MKKLRPITLFFLLLGLTTVQAQNKERTFYANGVNFIMKYVEGGSFNMGCSDKEAFYDWEKGIHNVTLSSYYIAETEVTQELWKIVMGYNNSEYKNDKAPVTNVSFFEILIFCAKISYMTGNDFRLPTEAEWEFAAMGGRKGKGYTFSGSKGVDEVGWYMVNSKEKPHNVKEKKPNELGIYDMTGNVWEFCSDWLGDFRTTPQKNPQGPDEGTLKVLKGGSWFVDSGMCGIKRRFFALPEQQSTSNGFRLALTQPIDE